MARPLMTDSWLKTLAKAKRSSIKIGRSLVGVEEAIHEVERSLDSYASSHLGGFFSGRETNEDTKLREVRSLLVLIHQQAGNAAKDYHQMIHKLNELVEMLDKAE